MPTQKLTEKKQKVNALMDFEIKQIEKKSNSLKLLIKGAPTELINSLRRTIINNVPTLAIEEITIYENNSVIFDEMLAHRLALLPIKTDLKSYKKGEAATFYIEKEGPCTVYGKDIKSKDTSIEIIGKKTPLVKLTKSQKIKVEMKAVLNSGKEHAKWQPAVIGYRNVSSITVDKECDLCEECIKQCPQKILEVKGKKIVLTDAVECNACKACVDSCGKRLLKIETLPNNFTLFIETHGQLENDEILLKAIEALQEKVSEFKKSISSLKE